MKAKAFIPTEASHGGATPAARTAERPLGAERHGTGRICDGQLWCLGLVSAMPAVSLLKIGFIGTAFSLLLALYGLVDSVGGLMFVPTRPTEERWAVKDVAAAARSRSTAKKNIGLR